MLSPNQENRITSANANLQIERVAKAGGAAPDQIAALVARHTTSLQSRDLW
jgi:K+-transporting ATPase c subunit